MLHSISSSTTSTDPDTMVARAALAKTAFPSQTRARAAPDRQAARLLRLNLLAAAAFGAILGFARLSYGLLLPSIQADLHGSYAALGLVGSANLAGTLLGTLAVPLLLLRVRDRRRLNLVSLLSLSVTLAVAATSADVPQLAVWRFLTGLASGPAAVLTIALTLERSPLDRRGAASGLIWTGGAAGLVGSALLGPLLEAAPHLHAWRLAWPGMALVGLAAGLALHRALGTPPTPSSLAPDAPRRLASDPAGNDAGLSLWRRPLAWLTMSYFGFGASYIIYFTFAAALLRQQGAPAALASFLWALLGLAGLLGGVAWGRVADGRARLAALPVCLVVAALGGLAMLTGSLVLELAGAVLMGACSFGVPSVATALLRQTIRDDRRYTSSLSLLSATVGVGQVLGPVVGGHVSDTSGLLAGISLAGLVMLASGLPAVAYGRGAARAR